MLSSRKLCDGQDCAIPCLGAPLQNHLHESPLQPRLLLVPPQGHLGEVGSLFWLGTEQGLCWPCPGDNAGTPRACAARAGCEEAGLCTHGGDSVPWLSHPPLQAAPGKIYQLYTTFTHSSQGRCPCSWQAVELDELAAPFQPRPLWDVVITREKRKTQK